MHIPDGFLDPKTWGAAYGLSGVTTGYALYRVRHFDEKKIPLLGITAAFIFVAQLINFPVGFGTSGHFLGAFLACVLLGPMEGYLVMVVVLLVQCLLLQDGGLLALGANVLNMGVIGGLLCYYLFAMARPLLAKMVGRKSSLLAGAAVFSWLSVVLASAACACELAISGTARLVTLLPTLVGVSALIGIGESLITTTVLAVVVQVRPDLIEGYQDDAAVLRSAAGEGEVA